ncbi:MAG: hypothetical protein QM535_12255 [Limnohabitans sp.]|nr:hypothetical protein [Limnohabitans sp.]
MHFLIFINCKNEADKKTIKKSDKLILEKIYSFDAKTWSTRTGKLDYECIDYENDSIHYYYGMLHDDYNEPKISEEGILYIKGIKQIVKITPKTKDSIVKLYNLKKFEFKPKRTYQHHFEYDDCILKRKIKMDSASVHTLQMKNGSVFQIIDVDKKPIWLQVCYKGKTYKEKIQSTTNAYGKLLTGNGFSKVMLYDIDKDGEEELLIFIYKFQRDSESADVYKINLPK